MFDRKFESEGEKDKALVPFKRTGHGGGEKGGGIVSKFGEGVEPKGDCRQEETRDEGRISASEKYSCCL